MIIVFTDSLDYCDCIQISLPVSISNQNMTSSAPRSDYASGSDADATVKEILFEYLVQYISHDKESRGSRNIRMLLKV